MWVQPEKWITRVFRLRDILQQSREVVIEHEGALVPGLRMKEKKAEGEGEEG